MEEMFEVIDDSAREDDGIGEQLRYTVTSYGADMPVDGIVSRLDRQHIVIPDFQRGFVWSQAQASRFIESLLLGIPVPGVFLFKDPGNGKLLVVDGQQRLRTLQAFHAGLFNKRQFNLVGVGQGFAGKTYVTLAGPDRRHLDDAVVHATIFQQDEPQDDRSSMYVVFERLNTGGTPLQPQEIRDCVYQGQFSVLLTELTGNSSWRAIYGDRNRRKKEEEIILRLLALYYDLDAYKRPMKKFLNDFMERHRDLEGLGALELRRRFESVVQIVEKTLGPKALRPDRGLNVALLDAVFVGLARRLDSGGVPDPGKLRQAHQELVEDFREGKLHTEGTTDEARVRARIEAGISKYRSVP